MPRMPSPGRIGDAPIETRYREAMNRVAAHLDHTFNGDRRGPDRDIGFVLMVFQFGSGGRANYISNAAREDIIVLLKEQLARFEGQPLTPGSA